MSTINSTTNTNLIDGSWGDMSLKGNPPNFNEDASAVSFKDWLSQAQPITSANEVQLNATNAIASALEQINQSQQQAQALKAQFIENPQSVNIEELMVSLNRAQLDLQMAVTVRNRILSAYQDIINMPV